MTLSFHNLCIWVLALLFPSAQAAKFFQNPSQLPEGHQYDFIVVGSGAGGGTVATRLAENKALSVLVIEAGASDKDFFEIQVPGLSQALPHAIDWNFTTVPQVNAGNRVMGYSRARVLGGCTSHNGMDYTRGSRDDYDQWAAITKEPHFSWDSMFPYMLKSEKYAQNIDHQSEVGHLNPAIHGYSGKIGVSAGYTEHPANNLIIETTKVMKNEFPFKLDSNDGRPIGVGWAQHTIKAGVRSSSSTGYLDTTGDNVHILLHTLVTRVLPTGNSSHSTDFRTVEFATGVQSPNIPQAPRQQLIARKEVIIAGGVINTPQILLNSGIGDKSALQALGIPSLVDNPSVGKNLSDQIGLFGLLPTTLPSTDFDMTAALAQWNKNHSGPLSRRGFVTLNHLGWVRLPANSPVLRGHADPTPGENSPHIEFIPVSVINVTGTSPIPLPPLTADVKTVMAFAAVNLHPITRGSVTLKSSNPFDAPNIDFNLLGSDLDLAILREAVRSTQRFFRASPWKNQVSEMILPPANVTTDDNALNSFIQSTVQPVLHTVGSAAMSPEGASWGVVDPDFRVKGTTGLRVVDGSVLPFVPSAHVQTPIYAFAERAADVIRQGHP
ncbi:Oxygen-dependent choline dehydrogenase [Leucoagaricus sp. SymC.cos]|nr:Oxygen-dependent choline dehydrogenase [Leucoagaricus sp. SymC.cos]